jgi:putative transcriptional regulator
MLGQGLARNHSTLGSHAPNHICTTTSTSTGLPPLTTLIASRSAMEKSFCSVVRPAPWTRHERVAARPRRTAILTRHLSLACCAPLAHSFLMNRKEFDKLVASVKQAGKIRRAEMKASRVFDMKPLDVKKIRRRLNLSQSDFALMIGVSLATLRNWEQGRRRPDGPAQALLKVAASNPKAVVDALAS